MSEDEQPQTIAAVERAADVLTLFAESGEASLGVTEVAQALDLSKAVVYRILSSFRVKGYIDLDPDTRRYALGPKALRLGVAYMDRLDVRRVARPELESLSARTDETATLSVRTGWERTYLDQVTPNRDVKMSVRVGHSVPLHAGASSKAFLAFLTDPELGEYFADHDLTALTDVTVTDERALRTELSRIRTSGYATSMGERLSGAASVAAPVFGADGEPAFVISVSGPLERFGERLDEVAPMLLEATARLSTLMGHRAA